METNNETQPKKARTLAQIEEEMAALRKQKRSVISKQKKQQIDALGKVAYKGDLSEQEMTELVKFMDMLKGFECPLERAHKLMNDFLVKNKPEENV